MIMNIPPKMRTACRFPRQAAFFF